MQKIFNRNETLYGPAPAAVAAIKNLNREHIFQYINGYHTSILIPALAKKFTIPEAQIITSYGSENFLETVFNSLRAGEDEVLTHQFHYIYYEKYLAFRGVKLHEFKLVQKPSEFLFDITDCIAQIKKIKPKLVLLTSPNNPTGNSITPDDLEKILAAAPPTTLVIVDEAYYGLNAAYPEKKFLALLAKYPNLAYGRTFSKLYALAGLRVAYALCGTNVKNLLRYQTHYLGMSRILEQVAVAALDAKPYYKKLAAAYAKDRAQFIRAVNKLKNFHAFTSDASFVLIHVDAKILPTFVATTQKASFLISKPVTENLYRISLDPKKYTKQFIALLKKIDA